VKLFLHPARLHPQRGQGGPWRGRAALARSLANFTYQHVANMPRAGAHRRRSSSGRRAAGQHDRSLSRPLRAFARKGIAR